VLNTATAKSMVEAEKFIYAFAGVNLEEYAKEILLEYKNAEAKESNKN